MRGAGIRFQAEDLDYLLDCAAVGRETRTRTVMHRRYVDGFSDPAIAAELGVSVSRVRACRCEAWKRIRTALRDTAVDIEEVLHVVVEQIRTLDRRDGETESVYQHAKALLQALRGPARHDPATPLMDDAGRKAANHDPLINAADAAVLISGGRLLWRDVDPETSRGLREEVDRRNREGS